MGGVDLVHSMSSAHFPIPAVRWRMRKLLI